MGLVTKPYTFTNGAGNVIDADQVNDDLDTLYSLVNGNIDSDNLAANSVGSSEIIEGTWTTPTLLAGVTSAASRTIQYYQAATGQVFLRGATAGTSSASGPLFTLPAGMRPAQVMRVPALIGNGEGTSVTIQLTGDILRGDSTNFPSGSDMVAASESRILDGISFMP